MVSPGRIIKERTLSYPGKTMVKEGDWVDPSAIIAKSDYTRDSARVVDLETELRTTLTPEMFDHMVLVKPSDRVKRGQPLVKFRGVETLPCPCSGIVDHMSRLRARIVIREDASELKSMEVVRVAEILNIHPRWLRATALVHEGDMVVEGQMLSDSSQAKNHERAYSPIAGVISRICPKTGAISIVRPMTSTKVHAYIPGRVVKVLDDLGAVIEGWGQIISGCFGAGGKTWGRLVLTDENPESVLEEDKLDLLEDKPETRIAGRILAAGAMTTYGALVKARSLGARGLITGGINYGDLLRFYHQSQEDPPFTVVLLEGAGFNPPKRHVWQTLCQSQGRIVSIDGTTVLGRDKILPEVIINQQPA